MMARSPEASAVAGAGSSPNSAAGRDRTPCPAALLGGKERVTLPSGRPLLLSHIDAVFLRELLAYGLCEKRPLIDLLHRRGMRANNLHNVTSRLAEHGVRLVHERAYRLRGSLGKLLWHDTVQLPNGRCMGTSTIAGVVLRELALRRGRAVLCDTIRAALYRDKIKHTEDSMRTSIATLIGSGVQIGYVHLIGVAPERVS